MEKHRREEAFVAREYKLVAVIIKSLESLYGLEFDSVYSSIEIVKDKKVFKQHLHVLGISSV